MASIPIKLEVIRRCVRHDLRFGSEGCLKCHPDFKTGVTVIAAWKEGDRVVDKDSLRIVTVPFDGIYAFTRRGVFVEGRMNGSKIFESMRVVEGDGFFILEPGDERPLKDATTDEIERVTQELELPTGPVCTCGMLPDKNCPVDHMGRNKPDPSTPGGDS